ncbi:MAG: hypothetical protein L0177_11595 [Chloroflexi bacterium]|nr:hypothetical protein [Chloroflexota bacterium]
MGAVRVQGTTSAPRVDINGIPAPVSPEGGFLQDIVLSEGVNLIKVTAADDTGMSVSRQLAVFYITSIAGLPFTLLHPADGLVLDEPFVDVIGVTRPDAVIGVNEIPTAANSLGIFSIRVPLAEGDNLIETVAVDIQNNVRFQTSVVFYLP